MASWANRANTESDFTWNEYGDLVVKNAVIMQGRTRSGNWSNFAGAPTTYNKQGGKRTFNLVLSARMAQELMDMGWNIRHMDPYDDQDDDLFFTEVVLNMNSKYEPRVYLGTSWNGKKSLNRLHGDMVNKLDDMRFEQLHLVIHPKENTPDSKFRYKGYCNQIEAIQREQSSRFMGDYSDYEYHDNEYDNNEDDGTEPF